MTFSQNPSQRPPSTTSGGASHKKKRRSQVDPHSHSEVTLGLRNGVRIAVKQWGSEHSETRILAAHGWLDNAGTWDCLAPLLVKALDARIVCMDFSGHGKSSHLPKCADYSMGFRIAEVIAVADALSWPTFTLMGHSMGGAISSLVAGTFPSRIDKLILVDCLGPMLSKGTTPVALERAIRALPSVGKRQPRTYENLDAAVKKYTKNLGYISESAAFHIVSRGTEEIELGDDQSPESAVRFTHDVRLTGKSLDMYSEVDVSEFVSRISCPVLLLLGTRGFGALYTENSDYKARLQRVQSLESHFFDSHHHLHLDLDHIREVSKKIAKFVRTPPSAALPAAKL